MKKWKKALTAFVVSAVMGLSVATAFGCGGGDDEEEDKKPGNEQVDDTHEHTWSGWKTSATEHWKETTCTGHAVEKKDEGSHEIGDNGKCSVCGYSEITRDGTKENPYFLEEGTTVINVPAGGAVYFEAGAPAKSYVNIMSDSTNVKLDIYMSLDGESVYTHESEDMFYYETTIEARAMYYLGFSTIDGEAEEYSINVTLTPVEEEEDPDPSGNTITLGTKVVKEDVSAYDGVTYTYTATASDSKLYFSWDEHTNLVVTYGETTLWGSDDTDAAKLIAGIDVTEGTVVSIEVTYNYGENYDETSGPISFTVDNKPISETPKVEHDDTHDTWGEWINDGVQGHHRECEVEGCSHEESGVHDTEGADGACSKCGYKEVVEEVVHTLVKVDDATLSNGSLSSELDELGITVANLGKEPSITDPENAKAYTSVFNGTELSLTKYLSTQGGIKGNVALKVEATEDLIIYVYAYNSGSGERYLALYDDTENNSSFIEGTNQGVADSSCATLSAVRFEVKAGETKYIGSTGSTVLIYAIGVVTGGNVVENKTASSVNAQDAKCEEAGNKAYTVSDYGRFYLVDGDKAVSYLDIKTSPLGHDYTDVVAEKVEDPTESATGKYTATCTRDPEHVYDIILPVLSDRSYERTSTGASGEGKYVYTYVDEITNVTITFEADAVEAEEANLENWTLDFTTAPLKPESNSSLTVGQVIGNVVTVTATGNGNLNKDGYLKVGDGGILTFKVEAAATLTIVFNNSNSSRTVAVAINGANVGDALKVNGASQSVTLSAGTCTLTFAGGDIQIKSLSLTYTA